MRIILFAVTIATLVASSTFLSINPLTILTIPITDTEKQILALQQVAGPISVEIKPGETKSFAWGLLTDKDETSTVNITGDGTGAEFLSYPKTVELSPKEIKNVEAKVTIPFDHPGGVKLSPAIHATEPSERRETNGSAALIDIQMAKNLSIVIDQNPFPEFRELIPTSYLEKVTISNRPVQIPIESTSNITSFNFDEENRTMTFNATGYAGTNGTTIIYPANVLEKPYFISVDGVAFTRFEDVTNETTGQIGVKLNYPHDDKHDNFLLAGAKVLNSSSK